jgi:SGNH hydrolase-like domain, acetyltransferase AlgX
MLPEKPEIGPQPGRARPIGVLRSEYVRRALLILGSFVFFLFLVEFAAFVHVVDFRELIGNNFAWWPIYNRLDPELIHIRRPYVHFHGEAAGGREAAILRIPPSDLTHYQWNVKCDAHGFRNPTDLQSADIALIGDSFVEGVTVPQAQLTSSLLAHLQGKVVANLGQGAYGPQQELIVLKRYGLPLHPGLVLWMFSAGSDLDDVAYYDRAMNHPPNLWHAYVQRSFLHIMYLRLFHPPYHPPGITRVGVFQAPNGKTVNLYFMDPAKPLTAENLAAIDRTARIVAEARNLSSAQGARTIFVFAPEKFRVFHDVCRFPQESECRNWVPNDMPALMEKAVRSISPDVGYLDLTPYLVEAAKKGAVPYYPDDDHWSPEGHQIAAEAINDYLLSMQEAVKAAAQ